MRQVIQKECKKHGLTDFSVRKSSGDRCKKCDVETVTRWRRNLKKRAVEYKGGKCKYCGYDKYCGALEFHHPHDNKEFSLGQGGITRSWKKVEVELNKCELVCRNCHAEIHNNNGV